jgi:hypothetical protein
VSLLGKEAIRLLRTKWKTPVPLAEELYAILQSDEPVDTGPLAVDGTQDPGQPAVTIKAPVGSTPLQIQVPGHDPISLTIGADGGLTWSAPVSSPSGDGQQPDQPAGGDVPCQVLSGGPGAGPYQVKLYPNGPGQAAGSTVSAKQLSIADDETIPAGTWALASKTGGSGGQPARYWLQVPVWGPDPS